MEGASSFEGGKMAATGATDLEVIAAQIGRAPRGDVAVAVRCRHGVPMVIRTSPALADGRPFPTLFWLTCPARRRAVARLEAQGLIAEVQARVDDEPPLAAELSRASASYRRDRGPIAGESFERFIGGAADPRAIKCLHAHYAHHLATGSNPVGEIVERLVANVESGSRRDCAGCRGRQLEGHHGAST